MAISFPDQYQRDISHYTNTTQIMFHVEHIER